MKITADVGELTKALGTAQKKLNKASHELGRIGSNLSSSISLPLAAIGTVAVSTAQKFEQSMANAASVSGATAEEFEKMTALAREMGKTTVFSASEAADAMYFMASAGYKVEQMADSIAPVLNLASATQSELAFTTDTVISTLNQFGLKASDAERVTNVFASAIGNSQATLDKLAYSMRYAGPVANSLGYSIEETTATLGLLYNAGFKGEQAGSILRSALSRLLKPTKEISTALKSLNLSYDDVNPATNNFAEILAKLEKANISTSQAVALFGQEAGPGMMALVNQGSDALLKMQERITNTSAASDMAKRQLETFQGAMKLLKSQGEEVAISIGNILISILSNLLGKITPLIDKFNNLGGSSKEFAVKIALVAAAAGPVFLALSKVLSLLVTFSKVAKLALSPLTIKFALLTAAVIVLVNIFKNLYSENESFKKSVDSLLGSLSPIFEVLKSLGANLFELFGKKFEYIVPMIQTVVELLMKGIVFSLEAILPIIEKVLTAFNSLFGGIIKLLNGDFKGAFEDFKSFFINLWEGIWTCLKTVINAMIGGINGLLNLIGKGINSIISGLNKLKIDIPDWVPIFGGKTFGFNIPELSMPQIPMLAGGGVIPPNNEFLAVLGDQKSGTNIEAPLDTLVSAFTTASGEQLNKIFSVLSRKGNGEITVRFEGLSENAFLDALTPKVVGKAKNMGLI